MSNWFALVTSKNLNGQRWSVKDETQKALTIHKNPQSLKKISYKKGVKWF